ncbi:MAG: carbohydrate porin [Planctomycetota bacterium]
MKFTQVAVAMMVPMVLAGPLFAEEPPTGAKTSTLWERETLTNDWFGLGRQRAEQGVSVNLGLTQVYQANLRGGRSTHRRSGRYAGSYDLELELDTGKLFRLPGGSFFLLAEGSWSEGIDASSVGSLFGVNDDAGGERSIDVTELWYEQSLLDDTLRLRLGKLDLTGGFECQGCPVAFDGSAYANDETSQFLNGALVNNSTIPFPDNGLGVVAYLQPREGWYVAAGAADAQADARETGFNTAFQGRGDFFTIFETGVVPRLPSRNGRLPGAYRLGLWYDPQPKERFDGRGVKRDDVGFYLSFDQMILKENVDEEDTQGLGLFARYGLADSQVNEIKTFWSAGAQYQGLIPARDEDVLGFGVAQGRLSRTAGFTVSHETAMELYYNAEITPWLGITPSVQYVLNPGGLQGVDDTAVAGMRLQMSF